MNVSEQARGFAEEWVAAWNARDLERVLSHYADDVVFRSPRITVVTGDQSGIVLGKTNLGAYWRQALSGAPDLRFELQRVYVSSGTITIAYRNHRGQNAAETMIFNEHGLIREGIAAYE